jgi:hypothetical protein
VEDGNPVASLAFIQQRRILFFHTVYCTMNAPLYLEVIRHLESTQQADLPLATSGVLRYVWEHRFGEMLIEVVDGAVLVNGKRVEPAASSD